MYHSYEIQERIQVGIRMSEIYWPSPKVVILEANYPTRYLITQLLTPQGLEVYQAASISELRQTPIGDQVDEPETRDNVLLIVLGKRLPDGDASMVLMWLKQSKRWKDIPVILIDDRGSDKGEATARMLGASAYLEKPFSEADFLDKLMPLLPADQLAPGGKLPSLNHNLFTLLSKEVSRAKRSKTEVTIIVVDVVAERTNTSSAPSAADAGLFREGIGRIFNAATRTLREIDSVVPFGGKSFAAVLPLTGTEGAKIAQNRFNKSVEPVIEQYALSTGMQLKMFQGLANYPNDAEDWKALFETARQRLGKNVGEGSDKQTILTNEASISREKAA